MSKNQARFLRFLMLAAGIGGLYWLAHSGGFLEDVSVESVRTQVADAGPWGGVVYLIAFFVGVMLYLPGMVFIIAGILAFGKVHGAMLALLGGVGSATISMALLRLVGGKLLLEIERPLVKKLLSKLHDRPIRTVAVMRILLWVSPPLNTALALTGIRHREHFIGTVLGLTPVVLIVALTIEQFVS